MELSSRPSKLTLLLLNDSRKPANTSSAARSICNAMVPSLCLTIQQTFAPGCSKTVTRGRTAVWAVAVDEDHILLQEYPRRSTCEMTEELECSHHHSWPIVWSSEGWKYAVCINFSPFRRNVPWLEKLVTGDEKCVVYIKYTQKRQWLSHGEAGILTPRPELHPRKVMLSVWWNCKGVYRSSLGAATCKHQCH